MDAISPIGDQAAGGGEVTFEVDRGQFVPGCQRDDQITMTNLPMRFPSRSGRHSAERANAAMARSISPASRTLTGLTSTLSDGATAWIARELALPRSRPASRRTATRVTPGAICLSNSNHFPPMTVFEQKETGGIAARPRQAVDEAGADRIDDEREHDRHRAGRLQQRPDCRSARGQDDVWRERDQFCRVFANFGGIGCGPADVDAHVAPDGPAQLRQRLQERADAGLKFRIVRG